MVTDQSDGGPRGSSDSIDRRTFVKVAGAGTVSAGLAGCTGGDGGGGSGGETGGGGGTTTGGSASGGKYSDVSLSIWHAGITENKAGRRYINNIISNLESETGASISITGVPYSQLLKKWRAANAAGDLPDLVEVKTNPSFMAGGKGKNLAETDVWNNSKTKEMVAEGVLDFHKIWGKQAGSAEGALLTWPYGVEPYLPVWRRDVLEKAGVDPKSVEYDSAGTMSFEETANKLYKPIMNSSWGQQKGNYPSATGMKASDTEYVAHYPPKFGGSLTGPVNEAGTKAVVDQEPFRKAVRMQVDYIDKGYFHSNAVNMGDEEVTSQQWAGKIAENHVQDQGDVWSAYLTEQKQNMMDGMYRYGLPHSGGSGGQKTTLAWMDSMMFTEGNYKDSPKKLELAGMFMDRFATQPLKVTKNIGAVPISPKLIQEEDWYGANELRKRFWRGAVQKTLNDYTFSSPPAVKNGGAITYDTMATMYQRIMTQDWSVEKATSEAAKKINQILSEG